MEEFSNDSIWKIDYAVHFWRGLKPLAYPT